MAAILVLNSGSSSVKFGLYERAEEPQMLVHGQVRHLGEGAQLVMATGTGVVITDVSAASHAEAIHSILPALEPHMSGLWVAGVGHRIVHGGPEHATPVELTPEVRAGLRKYEPLAPLHQPHNLAAVDAACEICPDAIQIGCFDTAFHRGHSRVIDTFALPREFYDEGVRRYGFHGLSYEFIAQTIKERHPALFPKRLVIAHLGNGASMCALKGGESVCSTMGFSALEGLPMGTRCGQIDPGVILYLLEQKGMSPQDITTLLYKESGLLGLSGVASEMQDLLLSDRPEAEEAVDYFVSRAQREIASLAAVLGGIDGLVFSGGIGENASTIRERIVQGLGFLGLSVCTARNRANEVDIGDGPASVMVIPTDEEIVIARAVQVALESISMPSKSVCAAI